MKKNILKLIPLALFITSAHATSTPAPQYSWTGPYVGANLGFTTNNVEKNDYWCYWACDKILTVIKPLERGVWLLVITTYFNLIYYLGLKQI